MDRKKAKIRPVNLFFVELTVALLFFALSASVILKVFAAADEKQKLSTLTERSVICAQSIAEAYSVGGDIHFALREALGEDVQQSINTLALSSEMRPSADGEVTLTLAEEAESSDAGTLKRLSMRFSVGDRELLSISCAAYIPEIGGGADG